MAQRQLLGMVVACTVMRAFGDATVPTADRSGSRDNGLLKRYEGALIVAYEHQSFTDFSLPLSRLEPVAGKQDQHNNTWYEPRQKKALEGEYTRLVYLLPEHRSPLEGLRNYREEIMKQGGRVLFECRAEGCGGDAGRGSQGGGGLMSLAMYLFPEDRLTDAHFSNGRCAVSSHIGDQRYLAAEIPARQAHVSLLVYSLKDTNYCKAFNERTIVVVDIIENKAREQNMVRVTAEEMGVRIAKDGSVALYGIRFDFNKAEVKEESRPSLEQIAKLLRDVPGLELIVAGHTDNSGTMASNMELAQRRAAAVANELVTKYGVAKNRLTPVGVGQASPVASNKTEEGRARNRRVELVER